jgi:uncharacterized protein YyaL (SSP411 family)
MKMVKNHVLVMLLLAWFVSGCSGETPKTKENGSVMSAVLFTNHLVAQKSPYLLQHVHNPVDWYPWSEEAFEKARRENKPIFLSIGYSTCHWCHVMARESFENEEIAAILNRDFVSIKVDREERPDIDKVYMTYVQAATGSGGWPMSVWLTPDLKPFVGGTYYPPEDRYGRPGFKNILLQIASAWKTDRERIVTSSDAVLNQLQQSTTSASADTVDLERGLLEQAYQRIKASYDPRYGGFGGAPKFPRPSAPDFMLRYYARTGTQDALDMTLFTLRKMAEGGMHDPLGGGFHRYSVDERWHVPHFEKMLYDQAQLACTYLDAYQITRDPFYAAIARDILDYVKRDLTAGDGRFYSAEDADSPNPENPAEHAEGAFYVWERREIEKILGEESASIFDFYYDVQAGGNVLSDPQGEFLRKNILFAAHSIEETANRFNKPTDEIQAILSDARSRLLAARNARPRPHLDDKTITAWNGLMISGFARAAQALGDETYLAAATSAAAFIKRNLYNETTGTLMRRYRDGEAAVEGYADDYAFLIRGLLDLYEASFNVGDLTWALALQDRQNELFWDEAHGGYFSTTGEDKTVLLRMKNDYDGAEPSANSISLLNLLRLAQMTDNTAYRKKAEQTLKAFSRNLDRAPHAMPQMMAAFDYHLDKPKQIIIAGRCGSPDTEALIQAVHARFIPNKILMLADGADGQRALANHFEFIESIGMIDGKATAYVCENNVCKLPVNDVETLGRQLDETKKSF